LEWLKIGVVENRSGKFGVVANCSRKLQLGSHVACMHRSAKSPKWVRAPASTTFLYNHEREYENTRTRIISRIR
jgi:hypothetical protein